MKTETKWDRYVKFDGEFWQAEGNGTIECFDTREAAETWLEQQFNGVPPTPIEN